MSCTASADTARPYGVKLVCRTWQQPRSSYYASRGGSGPQPRLAPPGKRGPKTGLSDDRTPGTDPGGPGGLAVSGRGTPQGLGPAPGAGRRHGGPPPGSAAHAGEQPPLSLWGRRGNPNLHHGEIITQAPNRHVGHRRRQSLHRGGRLGLALRRGGALERRVHGLARLQTGDPLCRPGACFPGPDGHHGFGDCGRRPGSGLAYGPRHPVPVGSFPESVETLGHKPQLRLYRTTADQWGGRTLYPDPQGTGHLWPDISEPAGVARCSQALRAHLQPGVAGGKKRLSKPMAGPSPLDSTELCHGGLRKTCVQKTGCGT